VGALAVADHFLYAWHWRDAKTAARLVTDKVRRESPGDQLEEFLGGLSNPHLVSFEVGNGRRLGAGQYAFDVRSFETYSGDAKAHPLWQAMKIVVAKTNGNAWAIDHIPTPYHNQILKAEMRVVRADYDYALRSANNVLNDWLRGVREPLSFTLSKRARVRWSNARIEAYLHGSSGRRHEAYELWDGETKGAKGFVFPVVLYEMDGDGNQYIHKSRIVLNKPHTERAPKRASSETWTVDLLP
jgi:hypothetical protein